MRSQEIVDQYIDEIGLGIPFKADELAHWYSEQIGKFVYTLSASSMLQVHCRSHEGPNPAKYVLERVGYGTGAYWYAMTPEQAFNSAKMSTIDVINRLQNYIIRRANAAAQSDPKVSEQWQEKHIRLEIAMGIVGGIADEMTA